jgi:exonuclease III
LRDVEGISAPWRERTVSAIVDTPSGPIEAHTVYVPEGATGPAIGQRWLRAETFEAIHARLARVSSMPRLLCGDFNAPHAELPDGTIVPFGRPGRDADAELLVLRDLALIGLVDAFRTVHGFGVSAYSWRGRRNDYRIDHILASVGLRPVRAEYHCHLIEAHLSDHAAIDVTFESQENSDHAAIDISLESGSRRGY